MRRLTTGIYLLATCVFASTALAQTGFAWGDMTLGYRHLACNFHGDQPLNKFAFSGPIFGVGFKF